MASRSFTASDFNLISYFYWDPGGDIYEGPSAESRTVTFDISSLPSGWRFSSATITANVGSPMHGVTYLRINGTSVSTSSTASVPVSITSGASTCSVLFEFKVGTDDKGGDYNAGTVSFSNITLTVNYTVYTPPSPPSPPVNPEPTVTNSALQRSENGVIVKYMIFRAEEGKLIPYNLYHGEDGKLVKY